MQICDKITIFSKFVPKKRGLIGSLCDFSRFLRIGAGISERDGSLLVSENNKHLNTMNEEKVLAALKKSGKILYTTQLLSVCKTDRGWKTLCRITRGFRHQVRCHLAWIGLPVMGDAVYNMNYSGTENSCDMQFFASELEFPHPITGEKRIWKISPDAI